MRLPRLLLLLLLLPGPGLLQLRSAETAETPAPKGGLLDLALRSPRERAGDYDGLAAEWLEGIQAAAAAAAPSPPGSAPSPLGPPGGRFEGAVRLLVPDELVLELLLRRLHAIRPLLADEKALLPALEAAYRLRYPDGMYRQILRGLLGDLYRRAGREDDRAALQAGDGFLRRWAVIGPFGIGGASQL